MNSNIDLHEEHAVMFTVSPGEEYNFQANKNEYYTHAEFKEYLESTTLSKRRVSKILSGYLPYFDETDIGPVWRREGVHKWVADEMTNFNRGHFPTGTRCIVRVGHDPEIEVTALGVVNNGPHSWVIKTDQFNTLLDLYDSYNIAHVTKILERGEGSYYPSGDGSEYDWFENSVKRIMKYNSKHHSHYVFDSFEALVGQMLEKHPKYHEAADDHLYDTAKVCELLRKRIKVSGGIYGKPYHYSVSKKKLHQHLPRILAKCRINRKKEQEAYSREMNRMYREQDERFDLFDFEDGESDVED